MTIIETFVNKALSEESQFNISTSKKHDWSLFCIKADADKAKCIYGCELYEKDSKSLINTSLSPYAIVANEKVYIIQAYHLGVYGSNTELPDNTFFLSNLTENINKDIREVTFPAFLKSLEIRKLTEEEETHAYSQVRKLVLNNDGKVKIRMSDSSLFTDEMTANMLYTFSDEEKYSTQHFEKDKDYYIKQKSVNNRVEQLIKEKYDVEDWEIEMTNALKKLEAKKVKVEFVFQGKTAKESLEKQFLLRAIDYKLDISRYDFGTTKIGENVLESLGISLRHSTGNGLMCQHISKITYGKKVIYSK